MHRSGGTEVIAKDLAEPLAKQRDVAAAHDCSVVHAVNLKLAC